jgi:hypothetical protein
LGIAFYSNRYKELTHASDSDSNELDGCDFDSSFRHFSGFSGYRALPFFIFKPKLKIEYTEIQESRDCIIYLHNVGKRTASAVRIRFIVRPEIRSSNEPPTDTIYRTLNPDSPSELKPFDLDPDETRRIRICEIRGEDKRVIFNQDDREFRLPSFAVERGRKYELLIRFVGKNFLDRKVWRFRLDLMRKESKFDLVVSHIFS